MNVYIIIIHENSSRVNQLLSPGISWWIMKEWGWGFSYTGSIYNISIFLIVVKFRKRIKRIAPANEYNRVGVYGSIF